MGRGFLAYLLKLQEKKPVICCGDLNVAHQEIDLKNPKTNRKNAGFTDEERACFSRALESGFIDTFRYFIRIKKAFIPGGPIVSVHERRTPAGVSTISLFPLP